MIKSNDFKDMSYIIFKFINKKKFVILLIFIVFKLIFSLPIPIIQKSLIDNIVNKDIKTLLILTLLLVFISFAQIFTNIYYNIQYSLFIQDLSFKFRLSIVNKILKAKYDSTRNMNSSYILNRIYTDTDEIESFILNIILNFTSNIITFLYGLFLIFTINHKIALVIFTIIFIWSFMYPFFKRNLYIYNYNLKEENSKLFSKFNESLSMIETIKKNYSYEVEFNNLNLKYNNMMMHFKKFIKLQSIFTSITASINVFISIIIICIGAIEIYNNKMSIGDLFAINSSVTFMVSPIQSFIKILSDFPNFNVSCNRILEIYKLPSNKEGKINIEEIKSIQLKNIKFSFSNEKLLNEITQKFQKNKIYIIYGKNGSGKTSLINILLKLLDRDDGEIIINDSFDIDDVSTESYIEKISIVEQEQRLIYDTLFNNMIYNIKTDISESRFNELIKLVGLEQFIKKLPNGLNTIIEENSNNISGGQKQKIAIFRALLKESDVLVLDEPTSALDSISIDELESILNKVKENRIVIIVSHNKNFMSYNKEVIDLDKLEFN